MEERYIRNLGALTEQECAQLRTKTVFVAGCGGLGGYLIEMLLRLGVGAIRAADGDVFEASNLNRQLLSSPRNLGRSKAEAAEDRAAELIQGCDAVLDALDNIPARRILARVCGEAGIPMIHGAICSWTAQAAVIMPGDDLIDRIYPEGASPSSKASLSFTPPFCAALQTALCTRLLVGRPLETGRFYIADLLDPEIARIF